MGNGTHSFRGDQTPGRRELQSAKYFMCDKLPPAAGYQFMPISPSSLTEGVLIMAQIKIQCHTALTIELCNAHVTDQMSCLLPPTMY